MRVCARVRSRESVRAGKSERSSERVSERVCAVCMVVGRVRRECRE